MARELLAERLALEQPLRGQVEGALRDADPPHRVREPAAGQALLGDHEPLALLPEQVPERHPHILEGDRRVAARGVRAHPLRVALDRPAGRVGRDEDQRVVAVPRRLVVPGLADDDRERRAVAARDAPLAPVDHPRVAVADRGGLQVRRIRARHVRLGHREA